jgi:ABC-type polysaccharide/polyol phosphate transport system ATPase subunit
MAEVAIRVKGVSKEFRIPHEKMTSLKQSAVSLFNFGGRSYTTLEAVNDVTFEIKKGEFFGIVGRNGSGKSTLLKLLAQIYVPTKGEIEINGSLSPFIELGVGFNMELTARENIFLSGAILGLSRNTLREKFDEIVAFAELEEFIDQKLKNFSSGMQVRLAFSIAIQAKSDILLIDEVLAVGDTSFQQKCFAAFREIKKAGKTVIFVSHDMGAVQEYCDRAILIEKGRLIDEGKTGDVAKHYNEVNVEESERRSVGAGDAGDRWGDRTVVIKDVQTTNTGKTKKIYRPGEKIAVSFVIEAKKAVESPVLGLTLKSLDGQMLFATNTKLQKVEVPDMKKGQKMRVTFDIDGVFNNGSYLISPAVASRDASIFYDWLEGAARLTVAGNEASLGPVQPGHTITVSGA